MLVGPGVSGLMAVGCLSLSFLNRKARYLHLLAGALALFAVAVLVHTLSVPSRAENATLIANACYAGSMLCLCESILQRVGKSLGRMLPLSAFTLIMAGLYYFLLISPDLITRILIMNLGGATLLLFSTARARSLWKNSTIDRVLLIALLGFALSFFLRIWLTLGDLSPTTALAALSLSTYGITLQLSLTFSAVILTLILMTTSVLDRVCELNHERQHDPLTGLLNRLGFEERLAGYYGRRPGDELASLISCDLDYFKRVNDQYGHKAGDKVLQAVARLLYEGIRTNDQAVRWGGEEFLVFMPGSSILQATILAERLCKAISELAPPTLPKGCRITASFGVAQIRASESFDTLATRADAQMYAAKRSGRDRVMSDEISERMTS